MADRQIEEKCTGWRWSSSPRRYPAGWGGAAVVHTSADRYYLSVALENANLSPSLCIKVGAMCEAYRFGEKITHCL